MATDHERGLTMDERTQAIINALKQQRNGAADALAEQIGEYARLNAEWSARWSDVNALRARLEELQT